MSIFLELADYRRRVHALYAHVRDNQIPIKQRWRDWVETRDALFATHPQTALSAQQQAGFSGLNYYDYDPSWRLLLDLDVNLEPEQFEIPLQEDGNFHMQRIGRVHFEVKGNQAALALFWVQGYGGGLFLPFRDASGKSGETYPGTRYLLDTIKGADLGEENGKLVLDFNFAYNPSCAYHPRWQCPLAPQENWLDVAIPVGEKAYTGDPA